MDVEEHYIGLTAAAYLKRYTKTFEQAGVLIPKKLPARTMLT